MIIRIDGKRKTRLNKELLAEGLKICNTCREKKPLTDFHKHRSRLGGVSDECKECTSSRHRMKYAIDGWKGHEKLKDLKRTAKRCNVPFNLTSQDIQNAFDRQKGLCYYSKIPMEKKTNSTYGISVDRIIPANGYVPENIALCCYIINVMKLDMSYEVFLNMCKKIVKNQLPIKKGLGQRLDEFNKKNFYGSQNSAPVKKED